MMHQPSARAHFRDEFLELVLVQSAQVRNCHRLGEAGVQALEHVELGKQRAKLGHRWRLGLDFGGFGGRRDRRAVRGAEVTIRGSFREPAARRTALPRRA